MGNQKHPFCTLFLSYSVLVLLHVIKKKKFIRTIHTGDEAQLCIANYCTTWFYMRHAPLCARCTRTCPCSFSCVSARSIEWMSEFAFYAISCAFTNNVYECRKNSTTVATVTLNIWNIIMPLDTTWMCLSLVPCEWVTRYVCPCIR